LITSHKHTYYLLGSSLGPCSTWCYSDTAKSQLLHSVLSVFHGSHTISGSFRSEEEVLACSCSLDTYHLPYLIPYLFSSSLLGSIPKRDNNVYTSFSTCTYQILSKSTRSLINPFGLNKLVNKRWVHLADFITAPRESGFCNRHLQLAHMGLGYI